MIANCFSSTNIFLGHSKMFVSASVVIPWAISPNKTKFGHNYGLCFKIRPENEENVISAKPRANNCPYLKPESHCSLVAFFMRGVIQLDGSKFIYMGASEEVKGKGKERSAKQPYPAQSSGSCVKAKARCSISRCTIHATSTPRQRHVGKDSLVTFLAISPSTQSIIG
jgi:hypothetical protein